MHRLFTWTTPLLQSTIQQLLSFFDSMVVCSLQGQSLTSPRPDQSGSPKASSQHSKIRNSRNRTLTGSILVEDDIVDGETTEHTQVKVGSLALQYRTLHQAEKDDDFPFVLQQRTLTRHKRCVKHQTS